MELRESLEPVRMRECATCGHGWVMYALIDNDGNVAVLRRGMVVRDALWCVDHKPTS